MTVLHIAHPSLEERAEHGRRAREHTPLDSHAGWRPAADRADPVTLLTEQNVTRDQDLVPVRHGRMMASPFTFYRGAARVMAADLSATPTAGLDAQLCGDAHLSNFGAFASPERRLLFDLNDFDETLPGPFEYDVKRMAASFTIAARNNGFSKADTTAATMASVTAYREAMAGFAQMGTLEVWYAHLDEDDIRAALRTALEGAERSEENGRGSHGKKDRKAGKAGKVKLDRSLQKAVKVADKTLLKAHSRDSLQALSKLAEFVDGGYRIVSQPPIVVPIRDLETTYSMSGTETDQIIRDQFASYRTTLQDDRRRLLERFEVIDAARKVVGVGSVGTRAFIVLLQGRDAHDPLFLQVKEATSSVLEEFLPKSRFAQPGERVVQGQRLMQAASDIFLGWTAGAEVNRHFYWRQLRDMKGSAVVERMIPAGLTVYAEMCGWTLARAHARSGDPVAVAQYLGDGDTFDRSITDFSSRYADQNEQDFEEFVGAIRAGRLQATEGV